MRKEDAPNSKMADPGLTVDILLKLNFRSLTEDWVRDAWDQDFTVCDELPVETDEDLQQSGFHLTELRAASKALKPWIQHQAEEGEGFWKILGDNDLPHKSLVAYLYYFIVQGQKKTSTFVQKEAGVFAAQMYFTLLRIPGSGAFKIFHPMLFEKAITIFKLWSQLNSESGEKKKRKASSPVRASQNQRRGGRRGQRAHMTFGSDSEEESAGEEEEMSAQQLKSLHDRYLQLLRDFVSLLESYTLRSAEHSVQVAVQALVDLSKMDPDTFCGKFEENAVVQRMFSVPELAYRGLIFLASGNHGDTTACSTGVFKHVLPVILMMMGDNKAVAAQTIPRAVQTSKDHAVAFVCHLVETGRELVLPSVRILLQHMCDKVPDKAEYRSRVAQAVITILNKLPTATYARFLEWVYRFGRTAKIGHRVFALDVVSLLLGQPERQSDDSVPEDIQVYITHAFFIQMLLARCSDVASTVCARAIQGFAQVSSSAEPTMKDTIRQMVTPRALLRPPVSRVVPTPAGTRTASADSDREAESTSESDQATKTVPAENEEKKADEEKQTDEADKTAGETDRTAVNASGVARPSTMGKTPGMTIRYDDKGTPLVSMEVTPGVEITLADGKGVTSMLRWRAGDEKVNVRKAALQALESVVRLEGDAYSKEDLKTLHDRTMDPALSVRKQAMLSLTEILLEIPHDKHVQKQWLDGVLPMVMDRETSASEKGLEIVDEIIIANIVPYQRSHDGCHKMVWSLLEEVAGNNGADLRRFLNKAFCAWGRAGKLRTSLVGYLQTHIGTENNNGVWMLLAEMAPFVPKLNHNFIVNYWREHACNALGSEHQMVNRVLTVLGLVAKNIPDADIQPIEEELKTRLLRFDSPPELVSCTLTTLHKLGLAESDSRAAQKRLNTFYVDLLRTCDQYLSGIILAETNDLASEEERVLKHLFTLGEVAQLCPAHIPKRVFMLVQSLIASPVISADASSQEYPYPQTQTSTQNLTPDQSQESQPQPDTQNPTPDPSQDSQSQTEKRPDSLPSGVENSSQGFSQGALSQFRGASRMSSKIRAHAFITLGKLCLQHEDVAKRSVAALARELEVSSDPVIRNNVVIILADLCVRYTTLVDHYVPNISSCLRDETPLVRKQTLTLLTHLLQEDYLKWKGSLFYRFVATINDDDNDIRSFAEFCLAHLLVQRHPTMFFQHFVECVFHFNSYENHNVYNKFSQSDRERKMFSLKGRQHFDKRMNIYKFMLDHMTDENKFNLTAKLSNDVLGAVVDGVIPLDSETSALLQDTLTILCCKEMKLSSMKTKPADDIAENEAEMAAAVVNAAKKTLISAVVKRNVIENIVPIVISLKHTLEKQRSPVLRDLMMFLRELSKDYKNEVQDIMSGDRQLANEIEFDLRRFEEQQQEAERQQRRASQGAPLIQTVASPVRSPAPAKGATPARASPRGATPGRTAPAPAAAPSTPRGAAAPQTPGRAGATPPIPMMVSPHNVVRTPSGKAVSMPTMAMLNSVRKAMEQARRVSMRGRDSPGAGGSGSTATPGRTAAGAHSPKPSTPAANKPSTPASRSDAAPDSSTPTPQRSKRVGWAESVSDNQDSQDDANSFKTPVRKSSRNPSTPHRRAISTPFGQNPNITFVDNNVSMIPPLSPIPSAIPLRLYPENAPQRTSADSTGIPGGVPRDAQARGDVIHVFSPDKPLPKPRTWNVKSPAPARAKKNLEIPRFSSSEDEAESGGEENAPPREGGRDAAAQANRTGTRDTERTAPEPLKATSNQATGLPSHAEAGDISEDGPPSKRRSSRGNPSTPGAGDADQSQVSARTKRTPGGANPDDSIASRTRRSKSGSTPSAAKQSRQKKGAKRR